MQWRKMGRDWMKLNRLQVETLNRLAAGAVVVDGRAAGALERRGLAKYHGHYDWPVFGKRDYWSITRSGQRILRDLK